MYFIRGPLPEDVFVILKPQHESLALIEPIRFDFSANGQTNQTITITGLKPGHLEVTADSEPNDEWM